MDDLWGMEHENDEIRMLERQCELARLRGRMNYWRSLYHPHRRHGDRRQIIKAAAVIALAAAIVIAALLLPLSR